MALPPWRNTCCAATIALLARMATTFWKAMVGVIACPVLAGMICSMVARAAIVLKAGEGNDTLIGGGGGDRMSGGAGEDSFVFLDKKDSFGSGKGRDVITGFGEGDSIDLSAFELGFGDSEDDELEDEEDDELPDDFSFNAITTEDDEDESEEDEDEFSAVRIDDRGADSLLLVDSDQNGSYEMKILVKNYVLTFDDLVF